MLLDAGRGTSAALPRGRYCVRRRERAIRPRRPRRLTRLRAIFAARPRLTFARDDFLTEDFFTDERDDRRDWRDFLASAKSPPASISTRVITKTLIHLRRIRDIHEIKDRVWGFSSDDYITRFKSIKQSFDFAVNHLTLVLLAGYVLK
jgi:hypothetical protein